MTEKLSTGITTKNFKNNIGQIIPAGTEVEIVSCSEDGFDIEANVDGKNITILGVGWTL